MTINFHKYIKGNWFVKSLAMGVYAPSYKDLV